MSPGDLLGLEIPADPRALLAAGPEFLTQAFRATGALGAENRVTRIEHHAEWRGGSTGRKLLLSVSYQQDEPGLHEDLFVKFSRDLNDAHRDRGRIQMELETRFALLSTDAAFPISVPRCYCADYEAASGTGILVTERIAFGERGIEPHYEKCLDEELPDAPEHYRAIIRALATLAGSYKAGGLSGLATAFSFDPAKLAVRPRNGDAAAQLHRGVDAFQRFALTYPDLLPANVTDPAFVSAFARDVVLIAQHRHHYQELLQANRDLIALGHWNANIDNAWFWRDDEGELQCGLLDWGNVCEMNVAASLWGSLSGAAPELWDAHLDSLLATFTTEFRRSGGPDLGPDELKVHLLVHVALMGITWLLDNPALIEGRVPNLRDLRGRSDPYFRADELSRSRLNMLAVFLNAWERHDLGRVLRGIVPTT